MSFNNSKLINAWCSYDIANSVYKLLITTVLFPIYYHAVTSNAFGGDIINLGGFAIKNTVLYDYGLSAAYLIVAFVSPVLSGIADYSNSRKRFMQVFTFIGALSCFAMYWFKGDNIIYGMLTIVFAAIGYESAVLFYNSFLPFIAPRHQHDRISARGYSFGYAGSMVLLIFNLVIILNYSRVGFQTELAALRVSFLQVGAWWFIISLVAFAFLKDSNPKSAPRHALVINGLTELLKVQKQVLGNITTRRFLSAFFFWSMGLQTLMLVAIMFGKSEIGIEGTKLIITIIILQLLAIAGATLFGVLSKKRGNKFSIMLMLCIWLAVCVGGYFVNSTIQFYILAAGVGLVMGGIQSQSRSTFSKIIPGSSTDTASYFSFYNFAEKMAIVIGMFSFGFIEHLTGSSRNSVLALCLYFIVAMLIFAFTPLKND